MVYKFVPGEAAAICQRCGFKYRRSQLHREWTGLQVCRGPTTNNCWEPRHPQDFVRGVVDDQRVKGGVVPEPPDTFLSPGDVNPRTL